MGNPFFEESHDLLVFDTKNIMDASVVKTVRKIKSLGQEQYKKCVEERLQQSLKPITETLSKNNLLLFSRPTIKSPLKEKLQLAALKKDRDLFMRLYSACQTRGGDLDQLFSHEIQAVPPALSCGGKQRIGTKADLLYCFESCVASKPQSTPEVDAIILDGAVVVHMLHPGTVKTFQEYADFVFGLYISSQIDKTSRVDVVWDVYLPESLKGTTRQKREKGFRRRVFPSTTIPKSWKDFLRVDDNKTELFKFLTQHVTCLTVDEGKVLYATSAQDVLSSTCQAELSNLTPYSQEEADTRLILHAADAVAQGKRKVSVRTVDTDVVVLAATFFSQMKPDEMWIAFNTEKNFRFIPIHEIVFSFTPKTCFSLLAFHAFTGCDTVPSFGGRGKKQPV